MTHYLDAAVKAACAAGEMLRHNFEKPMQVNQSTKHDIKLEIDVRAQELIAQSLLKEFPQHALYGEEGIVGDQASEFQWVVDPLDGTVNYYYGIPHFCVSIALRCQAEIILGVIFDPIRNELWTAQKGATPKLNDREFRVSERADLAEAIVSVGLSKTGITIEAGIPLLQTMVHRARKCRLLGSAAELHSALSNLVSNAVRYTPEGGTVRLAWRLADGAGVFSVTLLFAPSLLHMPHPVWAFAFALLGSAILAMLGLLAGMWADKFD